MNALNSLRAALTVPTVEARFLLEGDVISGLPTGIGIERVVERSKVAGQTTVDLKLADRRGATRWVELAPSQRVNHHGRNV